MQIMPRYLLKNRTTIIANEAGNVTEYRPVYSRTLQVYKGIDNVLEFRVLSSDQKPIDISTYTPKFVAYDEGKRLVISHDGTAILGDDSAATRGLFSITVTENDLLNIKQQYLSYNIYLVDRSNNKMLTYTDSHFGGNGIIYVSAEQFPGPTATHEVVVFTEYNFDAEYWYSESVSAEPAINGNEALHTVAIYTTSYIGDVVVQATLDNQITMTTAWADISTVSFTGTETEPKVANFNGVFSHIRFKATADPTEKITKILVRN